MELYILCIFIKGIFYFWLALMKERKKSQKPYQLDNAKNLYNWILEKYMSYGFMNKDMIILTYHLRDKI